uniref:sulfur carrier protein ThiS n=1 Tax=Mitsuokella jalaludinii TaxID=187979 RepID=UPI00307DA4AA
AVRVSLARASSGRMEGVDRPRTVNGKDLTTEKAINLKDLLVVAKAEQPDYVTVELNGEFVDHSGFESTFVKDGDKMEFLYFMGGGAR